MAFFRRRGGAPANSKPSTVKLTTTKRQETTPPHHQPEPAAHAQPKPGQVSSVFHGKWADAELSPCLGEGEDLDDMVHVKRQPMIVYVGDVYEADASSSAQTASSPSCPTSVLSCDTGAISTSSDYCPSSTYSAPDSYGKVASSRDAAVFRELRRARLLGVTAANRLDEETGGLDAGVDNAARISKIYHGLTPQLCKASRNLGSLLQ